MIKKDWVDNICSLREEYEKKCVENVNFNKKGCYDFIIPEEKEVKMEIELIMSGDILLGIIPKETEEEAIERYKGLYIAIAPAPSTFEIKGSINIKRIEEQNNILMEMLKEIEEEDKKNDR